MDYCSEAFLTLRLNAAGCQNVIKVLDVRQSTGSYLQRLIDSGNSGVITMMQVKEGSKYAMNGPSTET